jgi:hypothetical protein
MMKHPRPENPMYKGRRDGEPHAVPSHVHAAEKSPLQVEIDKKYINALAHGRLIMRRATEIESEVASVYYPPSSKHTWTGEPKKVSREAAIEASSVNDQLEAYKVDLVGDMAVKRDVEVTAEPSIV